MRPGRRQDDGRLIDGKAIAPACGESVRERVGGAQGRGDVEPCLAVLLVGENPASRVYVGMKQRAAEEVGIRRSTSGCRRHAAQEEFWRSWTRWNDDPGVHGILVQLPLPDHVGREGRSMERIRPEKDVDGFHPVNVGRMTSGDPDAFRPCTPAGVQVMLRRIGCDPAGKHAVIVGRSNIVGRPMATILSQKEPYANATVTMAHSRTADLAAITRLAELLVVAVGRPELVTGGHGARGRGRDRRGRQPGRRSSRPKRAIAWSGTWTSTRSRRRHPGSRRSPGASGR